MTERIPARITVAEMRAQIRACEIAEMRKLLDEVEAALHYQIFKTQRIRRLLLELEGSLEAGEGHSQDSGG